MHRRNQNQGNESTLAQLSKTVPGAKGFHLFGPTPRILGPQDQSFCCGIPGRTVSMFHSGTRESVMTPYVDIKSKRPIDQDAKRSQAKLDRFDYERVFNLLPAACAILDRSFRFVEINDQYLATLNASRGTLLGRRVLDAFPEIEEHQRPVADAFARALSGQQTMLEEILYAVPDRDLENGMRNNWWSVHFTPLVDSRGQVTRVLMTVADITEQVIAREMKDVIAKEMQHRIGNLLATVNVIARLTARGQTSLERFIPDFEARIQSLVQTHSLLIAGNWEGMTIDRLVHQQLDTYADKLNSTIFVEGPDLHVSAGEAKSISMALHELATNAAKHGALNQEGARLTISWSKLANGFEFVWKETGLKGVSEPTRSGFGTMILTQILPSQLNGEATRQFTNDGYSYRLRVPERAGHNYSLE